MRDAEDAEDYVPGGGREATASAVRFCGGMYGIVEPACIFPVGRICCIGTVLVPLSCDVVLGVMCDTVAEVPLVRTLRFEWKELPAIA